MYWLAGWCTYELLRHLERVHLSLKPQRYVLYLMSVVKNVKSKSYSLFGFFGPEMLFFIVHRPPQATNEPTVNCK